VVFGVPEAFYDGLGDERTRKMLKEILVELAPMDRTTVAPVGAVIVQAGVRGEAVP
jgi:hypothetical protein